MDIIIGFAIFIAAMLTSILSGHSIVLGLCAGFVTFMLLGLRRDVPFKKLLRASFASALESRSVAGILVIIGIITALWRSSGTIMVIVYYGIQIISPASFLMITFVISCLLSYALGTSFGVAGTVGVIFMTLARSGGVDPVITAGVILSGVFFGDRGSPLSGTALMVAGITGTDIYGNVKRMMKSALPAVLICLAIYGFLSLRNPITSVDQDVLSSIASEYAITMWAFVPAILMLVLPFLKVGLILSLTASIISAALITWKLQGMSLLSILQASALGYTTEDAALAGIINGGGIISMMETILIVMISCSFSGIFSEARLLEPLQKLLVRASDKAGSIPLMILISLASSAAFCNQVAAIQMCSDFMRPVYEGERKSSEDFALDIENTAITVPAFIPWSIICTVPLALLRAGYGSMIYAVFLYVIPICAWIRQAVRLLTLKTSLQPQ